MAQKAAGIGIMLATGLPIPIGRTKQVVRKKENVELNLYAEIFLTSPDRRLRIDAQQLPYTFLKEKMGHSAMVNFRTLFADLLSGAPAALKTRGARVLSEGKPLTSMGYDSLADADKEADWFFNLLAGGV